jgi:hypothetical protein
MPRASVEHILRDIEALSEEDLLVLDRGLADRLGKQWERQLRDARDEARRRGIDQPAIDQVIERNRYGRPQ